MEQYAHPEIETLIKENENGSCFDCGSPAPMFCSVSNSIYLCGKCAGIHKGFGILVSVVRSLCVDQWGNSQLAYLRNGGNKAYREFMESFSIPLNSSIDFKYMTKAADWYRQNLRAKINGVPLPAKPDLVHGLEILDLQTYSKTSKISLKEIPMTNHFNSDIPSEPQIKGFFDSAFEVISDIFSFAEKEASSLSQKVKDADIGQKLKDGGEKVGDFFTSAGNYTAQKGSEIIHSDVVQTIFHKTESGVCTVIDKTKELLESTTNKEPVFSDLEKEAPKEESNSSEKEDDVEITQVKDSEQKDH